MSETLIAALGGGLVASFVAGILTLIHLRMTQAEERRKDDFRFRRERLVEPIMRFTDELLGCISETYWTETERILEAAASGKTGREEAEGALSVAFQERLVSLRNQEAAIDARVAALKDPRLTEAFRALSLQWGNVRRAGAKGGFGAAREEANKASALGAEVLAAACRVAGIVGDAGEGAA